LIFYKDCRIKFDVSFYAYLFPNSELVSSTHAVGKVFDWQVVEMMGCVFAVLLIAAWMVIFSSHRLSDLEETFVCAR
jgi:tellurite resistance protein TehA-like permease